MKTRLAVQGALVVVLTLSGGGPAAAAEPTATPAPIPPMVLIPAGEFVMGMADAGHLSPPHTVRLDAFWLDTREVTNAEYLAFCRATGHTLPYFWGMREFRSGVDFPDHPVVGVTWHDAAEYAAWAGKRLPTEAEWEYAARGGLAGARFPTGDDLKKTEANFSGSGPEQVGSYDPNGYGLYDMAGNVAEWVMDYYDDDYYAESPKDNPKGPDKGAFSVVRGGGWKGGRMCSDVVNRTALKPYWVDFAVGFRCARDAAR
ncbi:MAG: formylglycine-generating enzyme family protein [Thermoanaerobaculaceae bacterium]